MAVGGHGQALGDQVSVRGVMSCSDRRATELHA